MGGMVLGRESIRSGDPSRYGDEFMTNRASETFAAEHTGHGALTVEKALEETDMRNTGHIKRCFSESNWE